MRGQSLTRLENIEKQAGLLRVDREQGVCRQCRNMVICFIWAAERDRSPVDAVSSLRLIQKGGGGKRMHRMIIGVDEAIGNPQQKINIGPRSPSKFEVVV